MAPFTVLVVLLKGTPSTVRLALVPPAGVAKVRLVFVLLLTASAPAVPVFWLCRASLEPVESLTTLAVTPQLFAELCVLM